MGTHTIVITIAQRLIKIKIMTKNSENLVLQNSDFVQNHVQFYRELMEDQEMTDITLAAEDSAIEAHKFILSATSPFFRGIIRSSRHQSPYVYLKGVKMEDLQALVTFMYTGETKVRAGDIKRFLTTAHELKIAGLIKNKGEGDVKANKKNTRSLLKKKKDSIEETLVEDMEPEDNEEIESMMENVEVEMMEGEAVVSELETSENQESEEISESYEDENDASNTDDIDKATSKEEVEKVKKEKAPKDRKKKIHIDPEVLKTEMNARLKYVFDRATQRPIHVCIECDVNFPNKKAARDHVELHLTGTGLICTNCGLSFKGKQGLSVHAKTCEV